MEEQRDSAVDLQHNPYGSVKQTIPNTYYSRQWAGKLETLIPQDDWIGGEEVVTAAFDNFQISRVVTFQVLRWAVAQGKANRRPVVHNGSVVYIYRKM